MYVIKCVLTTNDPWGYRKVEEGDNGEVEFFLMQGDSQSFVKKEGQYITLDNERYDR